MIIFGFLFLYVIMMTLTDSMAFDYCSANLCDVSHHIACNNSGDFAPGCPANAVNNIFTDELKQLAVDTHNKFRDRIARGKVRGYKKAARMAALVWNDELSKLAELNVRTCAFGHDECRNTAVFKYAGQNLGETATTGPFQSSEDVITSITKGWFDEYKYADMSFIDEYHASDSGKLVGHFTQVVRDEAYAIGCAIVQFTQNSWNTTLFACDYTLTNIIGEPIYVKSETTGSGCKTGVDSTYSGLCSTSEVYDNELYYNTIDAEQ